MDFLIKHYFNRYNDRIEVKEAQYHLEHRHKTFEINIRRNNNPFGINNSNSDNSQNTENINSGNNLNLGTIHNQYDYDENEEISNS